MRVQFTVDIDEWNKLQSLAKMLVTRMFQAIVETPH